MPGKGKPFNPNYVPNGPKPPCGRDCPDRKTGCAVKCEKWRAYLEERNAWYAAKLERLERRSPTKNAREARDRKAYHKKNAPGWH